MRMTVWRAITLRKQGKCRLAGVVVGLALIASATVVQAQSVDVAAIEKLIAQTVEESRLVGLSVGVMSDGHVVLARGYGVRSLETRDPVTPETMFAIGSVTKQFTCASVFLLAEEKKLSLEDKVGKYLPDLTRANDISLLDLGQHVSGYRDYYPLDFVDRAMAVPRPAASIIRDYATRPLDFEPGTRWSYSNTGFLILGNVIERVSGEPLGQFFDRHILSPLGLKHTQYEARRGQNGQAVGYTSFALGTPEVATPEAEGWLGAAGGLWSTPRDLLVWDLALTEGKVLSVSSYRTLATPRRLRDGRSTDYGCGIGVRDSGPAVLLTHGGGVSGFVARNTFVPATRSGVVLLANTDGAYSALEALADAIVPMLLPPNPGAPVVKGSSALSTAVSLMRQFQAGDVDRSQLGEEFNAFLTLERVKAAAASLGPLGDPKGVEVAEVDERGGMEVATIRFRFEQESVEASMYRTADGRIQQFLVSRR